MTEPVTPDVTPPGGAVLGPDGTLSFPDPSGGDQAAAAGLAPAAPGFPQPAPRAPAPPQVGSGQFTVDLERAPQALRELRAAREKLQSVRDDAQWLGHVDAPAADRVSLDAAQALGSTAVGGPGSFVAAVNDGIGNLDRIIQAAHQELVKYRSQEDRATTQLDSIDKA